MPAKTKWMLTQNNLLVQKSRQLGQNYISPEHIVLALFVAGDSAVKAVIERCAFRPCAYNNHERRPTAVQSDFSSSTIRNTRTGQLHIIGISKKVNVQAWGHKWREDHQGQGCGAAEGRQRDHRAAQGSHGGHCEVRAILAILMPSSVGYSSHPNM